MIVLIAGASHTGKTLLAQRLLEKYHFPYLSIDHLKMGLIRSGQSNLTVYDDESLTEYLWPIVCEMIKTAIENHQNLIVEGCYIPFSWKSSFPESYRSNIHAIWLILTRSYIENHFEDIISHANDIEHRIHDESLTEQFLVEENLHNLEGCQQFNCQYFLIDKKYEIGELPWLM